MSGDVLQIIHIPHGYDNPYEHYNGERVTRLPVSRCWHTQR